MNPNTENYDLPDTYARFQQDGVSPHYSTPERDYLDETFPHMWINSYETIECPARSPDLIPLDFFLYDPI